MTLATTMEEEWRLAARELSIEVAIPYAVDLPSGHRVEARVLVTGFGARRGMLLVDDYEKVRYVQRELVEKGYGYSVLEDPSPPGVSDATGVIDLLADWGWSGPPDARPAWLPDPPEDDDEA